MSMDPPDSVETSLERIRELLAEIAYPENGRQLSDAAFLDECAMRAMQSLLRANHPPHNDPNICMLMVANASFEQANVMLAERKRRQAGKSNMGEVIREELNRG